MKTLLSILLLSLFACVSFAQSRGGMDARIAQSGLKAGSSLPDLKLYDSEGKALSLKELQGHYSVLVFGCLT